MCSHLRFLWSVAYLIRAFSIAALVTLLISGLVVFSRYVIQYRSLETHMNVDIGYFFILSKFATVSKYTCAYKLRCNHL